MKTNPPAADDAPMLAKLAKIGLVPGQDFDVSKLDADFAKRMPQVAFDRIMLHFKISDGDVKNINGWAFTTKTGLYGTDYLQRALITAIGLGANRPQDAVYPTSLKDADGERLQRRRTNTSMHFAKGQLPPVKGFWSLTMYDERLLLRRQPDQPLFDQPAAEPRSPTPTARSTSISRTNRPGADKEANWLPAPKDKFILMLRMYWPDTAPPSIIDGTWTPPPVVVQG